MPAEALASAVGLHRNTLSKALRVLVDEGYLQRRPGRPARVVSTRAVLPARQSPMISHARVAHEHHLEMSSEVTRLERRQLARVDAPVRPMVARHLEIEPTEEVIVLSRIRRLRQEGTLGPWVPAIAETAYFAAARVPGTFFDDFGEPGRVESIYEYFTANNIRVVNSDYRIRISTLPEHLCAAWAKAAGIGPAQAKELRFLRLESTTHSHQGPIEYSMAFLAESLFALSATAFTVEIRSPDALRTGRRR